MQRLSAHIRRQSERVCFRHRIPLHIAVHVHAPLQPNRITGDKPLHHRIVIPRPVEHHPRPIVLTAGVLNRVFGDIRPDGDAFSIGAVAVAVLKAAGRCIVIAQLGNHTVQRVGHEDAAVGGVLLSAAVEGDSCNRLVQAQASQQPMGQLPASDLAQGLLSFIQVLHRLRGLAALGNAALDSAAIRVVGEAGADAVAGCCCCPGLRDLRQPVTRIPSVGGFVAGVGGVLLLGQVAGGVMAERVCFGGRSHSECDARHAVGGIVGRAHGRFALADAVVVQAGFAGSSSCGVVAVVDLLDQLLARLAFGLEVFDLRQALDAVVAVALGDEIGGAAALHFAGCQAAGVGVGVAGIVALDQVVVVVWLL